MQAKFKANCHKTLHISREKQSFVGLAGGCNPLMAFVV